MKNLVFRRQFLLTNRRAQFDVSWKKNNITKYKNDCTLYTHPDLEVTSIVTPDAELYLLGYVLDPFRPEHSNKDILERLSKANTFISLTAETDSLTGRYVLIHASNKTINVLHDATGFREVFYYKNNEDFACGSTPNIIVKYLNVERDDDKDLNDFFNSPQLNSPERRWVGDKTIFKGVRKLLPNHYLDLFLNKTFRFWPREERKIIDINKAADVAAHILTGTFDSAIRRFKIYQTLTSGWDTRLLLAASRKYIRQINFYFNRGFKSDGGSIDSVDFLVTKEIAGQNNLAIEFNEYEDLKVDKEFEGIYYSNNVLARPKLLKVYYNSYLKKLDNCITVSGTEGNSLLRLKSSLNRNASRALVFAHLLKYDTFPFVIKTIDEWLDGSKYLKDMNYKLIDLFYWEQNFPNWGTLSGSEQDIVWDELRPLNNRTLISTFGSLHDKYRYKDYPLGYVKTIKRLWPELLKYEMETKNYRLKKALRTVNLEQLADKVYQKMKA